MVLSHSPIRHGKTDDLGALTAWAEHGRAPKTLTATLTDSAGQTLTRDLATTPWCAATGPR